MITRLAAGPFPSDDGWGWLYRTFQRLATARGRLRRAVCRYFAPSGLERWRDGLVFRFLGVQHFGTVIPTGGIAVRRATKARMAPYTLAGTSLAAARAFYYRACVFEALHLPFFVVLTALSVHRAAIGRLDLALENMAINVVVNLYPMLHHRRTRARIVRLLLRAASRPRAAVAAGAAGQ